MAPLPQNATARYFFDYVTGNAATSQNHTVQVRCSNETTPEDAQEAFWSLLTAMGSARFGSGWRVIRVRYQAAGTDFSIPVTLGATLASFVGTGGNVSPPSEAIELTFQGRSFTSGRRGDLSLYGTVGYSLTTNYRLTPGEASWVGDAVAVLNSVETIVWRAVDGTRLTFYPYANWNYNSYWERKLRS